MKSELISTEHPITKEFPALYRSTTCEGVALFTSASSATILKSSRFLIIGETRSDFDRCDDTRSWQRLPSGSQVILTQD